jgi:molybdopterin-guanine dinucleotide biosynthesis protein A
MPYVQADAVSCMLSQLQGWDVVVPGDDSFMEPLFACYAKTCIPVIEDLLRQDVRKTQSLFRRVRCKYIPLDELRSFDPSLRLLQNINSPEDYQAAINERKGTSML